jgi:hypothetical protein
MDLHIKMIRYIHTIAADNAMNGHCSFKGSGKGIKFKIIASEIC